MNRYEWSSKRRWMRLIRSWKLSMILASNLAVNEVFSFAFNSSSSRCSFSSIAYSKSKYRQLPSIALVWYPFLSLLSWLQQIPVLISDRQQHTHHPRTPLLVSFPNSSMESRHQRQQQIVPWVSIYPQNHLSPEWEYLEYPMLQLLLSIIIPNIENYEISEFNISLPKRYFQITPCHTF